MPSHTQLEALGIDPDTFDVAAFEDTLSPKRAKALGLLSRLEATEIVAVVIASSTCKANSYEGFRDAVRDIPKLINTQYPNRPEVVARIVGVSTDQDAQLGAKYLASLAAFDEIIAGGGKLNTATEKYLWGSITVNRAVPTILLLQRSVLWTDTATIIQNERLLAAIHGADSVVDWVRRGAPINLVK